MARDAGLSLTYKDRLQFLSRGLSTLHTLWVSLTYPFVPFSHKVSIRDTCNLARRKAHRAKKNTVRMHPLPIGFIAHRHGPRVLIRTFASVQTP